MYHLSKALVFIACLAASIFVAWWVGLVALALAALVGTFAMKGGLK